MESQEKLQINDYKRKNRMAFYTLSFSRGVFFIVLVIILLPTVLELAKLHRQEDTQLHVLGIKTSPSAWVFILNTITSVLIIIFSPVVGAISDRNNNGKKIIRGMSILFLFSLMFVWALFFSDLWFFSAFLQIFTVSIFEVLNVVVNAFIPEIGENEKEFNEISSYSYICEVAAIFICLCVVPFLIHGGGPKNLIIHGNFDYYNSYSSWKLKDGASSSDYISCGPEQTNVPGSLSCWRSVRVGQNGMHDLRVYLPDNKKATLVQETDIKALKKEEYTFTVIASKENKLATEASLSLGVILKGNNSIEKTPLQSQKIKLNGQTNVLAKHQFYVDSNIKKAVFYVEITGEGKDTIIFERIETTKPVGESQILTIFFSGLIFVILSLLATLYLPGRQRNNEENSLTNSIESGLQQTLNCLRQVCDHKIISLYLLATSIWFAAYYATNITFILYLEDENSIDSSNLAELYLLFCVSIIIGSTLNYNMKSICSWKKALFAYGFWILTPLPVWLNSFPSTVPFQLFLVFLFGLSFGFVIPLRFTIYCTIIPLSEKGQYMGILIFAGRIVELLLGNLLILFLLRFINLTGVFYTCSGLFLISILILFYCHGKVEKERRKEEEERKRKSENIYIEPLSDD